MSKTYNNPKRDTIALNFSSINTRVDDIELSTKSQVYTYHIHKEIELLYVTEGEVDFEIGEKKTTVYEGDVIFINHLYPHRTTTTIKGTRCKLVQFNLANYINTKGSELEKHFNLILGDSSIPDYYIFRQSSPLTNEIRTLIENINTEFLKKNRSYEFYSMAYIYMLIAFLSRNKILPDYQEIFDRQTPPKVEAALSYINLHYSEDISLDTLCKVLSIDKYYFCKIFKNATNYTFTEYLNYLRVQKAEKLLSKTDKSISEIALEVGFSSVSYFNRIYRRFRPYTPLFFRKSKKSVFES